MSLTEVEQAAMHRALVLGETVRGTTSPNPAVGAVILDHSGHLVGEGATAPAGGPHAEVQALTSAGPAARGGTAVVTLEPCAHTGRTGPCAQALITAGVAKVIFAVTDPNPEASGGGEFLRAAGVEVLAGVEVDAARAGALRPWLHAVRSGRPFVTWKFASTLDGRVAAADGTSRWITSALSRSDVHALRASVDAIVVGSGTVLADDPQLTVRLDDRIATHQPLRVLLDRRHRVPDSSQIFDSSAETLVLDTAVPRFALKALFDRGVRHVLLEGGPTLAGAFIEDGCVDEVVAYLAPTLLGAGPSALGDAGINTITEALSLEMETVERIGNDLKIVARPTHAPTHEPSPHPDSQHHEPPKSEQEVPPQSGVDEHHQSARERLRQGIAEEEQ
ncbi:diaminohydroxyphosphoribosylaminopyrimidine deaminase/5-amino-6-(5-phosphoribosylamino)uracil reductase [Jatrophihabitans sp. GAS493]|uniref:bifunctional diaminohydroxyphosphoribosylaminopyrimidine deaminase/5-amino-6-(5-phosphoribosylamino)uracil reductase RibD n=1 Tax=Jatrophihabitans sp. GAS493 TaxID=1907575 RepID=UPI000BB6FB67|nr:bifunctional diaminohydroxyphosphoribosylaminopyrimidine deaminase/5-amino-6-(5-phosphoribosylamino)uracil reductase RibD [Jatrophihabitans sp. GAS493]SOD73731.1 diaminohydroxyphosphoribosylaminopyrimidine deaminase/5-amino-6-(5-phosphoribosylamino)uracil reductase [Jatrophihabitans sp. GAS493]